MRTDLVMLFVLVGVVAIALGWPAVRALRTGSLKPGAVTYERREQPVEFWFYLAFTAIVIGLLLWHLAERVQDSDDGRAVPLLLLFTVAAPAAFGLIRGIQTGSTGIGKSRFSRREQPGGYWGALLAHAAVAVAAFGLYYLFLSPRSLPAGSDYKQIVAPVVKTVREQLGNQPHLQFRNVRVDGKSRLVCGEVVADRRSRRFFGYAARDAGMIRLEDESPDFEPAFRRVCGAPGYVPTYG